MGFMKPPKIKIPDPEPVTAPEPPVRVEKIEEKTASDYNSSARRKKGILSTILAGKEGTSDSFRSSGGGDDRSTLRKTLG